MGSVRRALPRTYSAFLGRFDRPSDIQVSGVPAVLSGGDIKPLYHRVKSYQKKQRISLTYFLNPNSNIDHLAPWKINDSNSDINIVEMSNANPEKFGLPNLSYMAA